MILQSGMFPKMLGKQVHGTQHTPQSPCTSFVECPRVARSSMERAASVNSAMPLFVDLLKTSAMSVSVRGQPQHECKTDRCDQWTSLLKIDVRSCGRWVIQLSARSMQRPKHAPAMDEAQIVLQSRRSGSQNTSSRRGQKAHNLQEAPRSSAGDTSRGSHTRRVRLSTRIQWSSCCTRRFRLESVVGER